MSFIEDELDLVPALQRRIADLESLLADVRATNANKDQAIDNLSDHLERAKRAVVVIEEECDQLRHIASSAMVPIYCLDAVAIEMAHALSTKEERAMALDVANCVVRDEIERWVGSGSTGARSVYFHS